MADNVTADPGTGGATFATDDDGIAHHPYTKLEWGPDNTFTKVNTGAAALPIQDGGNVISVDDGGGSLTIDGAVAINAALPAGANNIGDVDVITLPPVTNAGTFAVQVTDIVPGVAASNLGKSEDAAHASGDTGVAFLAVRRDARAVGSATDGDYSTVNVNANGEVYVKHTDAIPVTDNGGVLSVDDGGSSITVDGTVAVTDGGGSLTIDGNVGITGTPTVDTELTTDDLDTGAGTDVRAVVGLVRAESGGGVLVGSANPLPISLNAAIPAGTNNIGDVDVVSLPAIPAGTNEIGKVRITDGTTDASVADLTNANPLHVAIVDGAGNQVTSFGGSGGTSATDDAAFTPASGAGTPIMGFADETAPDSVDEGDVGVVRMTLLRALHVNLRDASGNELAVGGGTQYDEDAASVGGEKLTLAGAVRRDARASSSATDGDYSTLNTNANGELYVKHTDAIPVTDNAGSLTVDNAALSVVGGGTEAAALRVTLANDSTGVVSIDDNGSSITVDGSVSLAAAIPAGTNNIGDVDVLTLPNVTLAAGTNTNEVVGDAAHDAAIAGNPVRIAGRAQSADYTAVASGDTADLLASLLGKLVNLPYALPGSTWFYAAASGGITNTTAVTIKAAAGVGIRNYITSAQIINGHATVDTDIQIRDGSAGTTLWRGILKAGGGGAAPKFEPPLRGSANTLLEVICGTTGAAVYVNFQGFVAAE